MDHIKSLIKAQSEMGKALKNSKNPHFKSNYADLSAALDACAKALHDNGFAILQPSGQDDNGMYVDTIFHHESGESLKSRVYLVVDKNNMQGVGSATTYARRYGIMGLAGLAPEDDDGNAAAANPPKQSWAETVVQDLAPGATPRDKAKEIAKALCAQWKRKKSHGELSNEWDRRESIILSMEAKHPDLHETIVDGYENRKNEITEQKEAA